MQQDQPPEEHDREQADGPDEQQPDADKPKGSLAWQRQDDEPDIELADEGGPGTTMQTATPPVIYFAEEVVAEMKRHACSETSHEIAGVLAGQVDHQHNTVHVHACIPARHTRASQGNVTFTHESWAQINAAMDADYPDYVILGWYHSHPNFGVFLSSYDTFIHQNFFSASWQIAYVVDPIRHDEGCFVWEAGALVRVPEIKLYVTTTTEGEPQDAGGMQPTETLTAGADMPQQPMPPAPTPRTDAGQKWALFLLSVMVVIAVLLQVYTLTEIFHVKKQMDTMLPPLQAGLEGAQWTVAQPPPAQTPEEQPAPGLVAEDQEPPEGVEIGPDIAVPPPGTIPCDTYEVIQGDTLAQISEKFYDTPDHADLIAAINGIARDEQLIAKTKLLIPRLPQTEGASDE